MMNNYFDCCDFLCNFARERAYGAFLVIQCPLPGFHPRLGETITGNMGSTGAGALANAVGATVMTIDECTIMENIAGGHGGAISNRMALW